MHKIFLIIISSFFLFFSCVESKKDKNTSVFDEQSDSILTNATIIDTITYRVVTSYEGPNETETNAHITLFTDSLNITIDSLELASCGIHDRNPPYFHFLANNLLIYENPPNEIIIRNLKTKQIILKQSGFFSFPSKQDTSGSIDSINNKIIYFEREPNKYDEFFVNILNLDSLDVEKIDTIQTSGDPLTGSPLVKYSYFGSRTIIIEFETKEYKFEELTLNY